MLPDDHIGIELEFVYFLTQKSMEALGSEEREKAARLTQIRNDFIKDHMALWVPAFVDNILEFALEDFYKGAALMLREFIDAYGRTI